MANIIYSTSEDSDASDLMAIGLDAVNLADPPSASALEAARKCFELDPDGDHDHHIAPIARVPSERS
jgi:hypothetical protein